MGLCIAEGMPPRYMDAPLPIVSHQAAPIVLNEFIATLDRICETQRFCPSLQLPRNVRKNAEENINRSLEGVVQNVEKKFKNYTTFRFLADHQSRRCTDLGRFEPNDCLVNNENGRTRRHTNEQSNESEDEADDVSDDSESGGDSFGSDADIDESITRSSKRRRISFYRSQSSGRLVRDTGNQLSNTPTNASGWPENSDQSRSLEVFDSNVPSSNTFSNVEEGEGFVSVLEEMFFGPRKKIPRPSNEDNGFTTVSDDEPCPIDAQNSQENFGVPPFGGPSFSENSLLRSAPEHINSVGRPESVEFTRDTVVGSRNNDVEDVATVNARTTSAAHMRNAPWRDGEMGDDCVRDTVEGFQHVNNPSSINMNDGQYQVAPSTRTPRYIEPEPLEEICRRMVDELQNSPLQCLRPENRFFVQKGKRPPANLAHVVDKINEQRTRVKVPMGPLIPPQTAVITVGFYNSENPNSLVQEFQVLSSQPLTALRDVFNCIFDFLPMGFERENISQSVAEAYTTPGSPCGHIPLEKRMAKSSYFFFENTFYNDMRDHQAEDYSRNIIDWTRRNARAGIGGETYTSAIMADTKFEDLTIRMGVPYLFVHHGNCEHIIIFKEMRGAHSTDGTVTAFPKTVFRKYTHRFKCRMCKSHTATVMTVDDILAGETPCFFCESCYVAFHYSSEGELLTHDHQMYRFPAICV